MGTKWASWHLIVWELHMKILFADWDGLKQSSFSSSAEKKTVEAAFLLLKAEKCESVPSDISHLVDLISLSVFLISFTLHGSAVVLNFRPWYLHTKPKVIFSVCDTFFHWNARRYASENWPLVSVPQSSGHYCSWGQQLETLWKTKKQHFYSLGCMTPTETHL